MGALLGLVVLVVGLLGGAGWAVTHRDRIRALVGPFLDRVARRYTRQVEWLASRLDPSSATGLSLTLGLAVLAGVGWAFGTVLEDVVGREELATIDSPVTSWLADNRVGWLTSVMRVVTTLGGAVFLVPLLLAVAVAALVRTRSPDTAGFLLAAAGGSALLVTLIKFLIGRTRPDLSYALEVFGGSAFPSGHSASTVAAYGALAHLATRRTVRWSRRVAAWTVVALLALLVGFSRIYLGAHWLTDVLGGWTLGAAWLTTVITATSTHRRLRAQEIR